MPFDGGAGRLLQWVRHAPRFAYDQVRFFRGGERCRAVLPYHNLSQPRFDVLQAVDMLDVRFFSTSEEEVHPCAMRMREELIDMAAAKKQDERLNIELPPVVGGDPLTLLVAQPPSVGGRIQVTSKRGRPIPVSPYVPTQHLGGGTWKSNEYSIYQIAVRDGEAITIRLPSAELTGLDIY